ncbi:MAG: hypothetical protein FK733_10685 [Asgard group archaeon]|nr:hypothetical protein [Asgard group archaeon]
MDSTSDSKNTLPLLLRNLKKVFGKNIQGPILLREREFQATAKSVFIFDLTKFLSIRGVDKMVAIHAWKGNNEVKLAYHFVARIGSEMLDSKISIVTFLSEDNKSIKSVKKIFSNAQVFEEEINKTYDVQFEEK